MCYHLFALGRTLLEASWTQDLWSLGKNQDSCFIIQKWRSNVTPRRASSSYRLHVHTFSHACTRMKCGSPPSLQHPILSKKTLEIHSVLAASPIFKKVGVSEQKLDSPLAYSSKYWKISLGKFLSIDLSSLFKLQQWLNPKKLGGKHGEKPQHNSKGNCTAERRASSCPAQKEKIEGYPCLIMPAKISWFFQPIPVFVGNLAQNSTRFSLSNEPFLLINHVFSFFVFMQITYWAHLCTYKTIVPRIFGRVSPFFQNHACFHKDFWEFKVKYKIEIILVFVQTNKF